MKEFKQIQKEANDRKGFVIVISDGHCVWQYLFNDSEDGFCIGDFVEAMEQQLKVKKIYSKLIL